jgi:hypothetical protein
MTLTRDWPHGYQLRAGNKVRVVCWDAKHTYPIIALVEHIREDGSKYETTQQFYSDGRVWSENFHESKSDLINAPAPQRRVEGVVYYYLEKGEVKVAFDKKENMPLPTALYFHKMEVSLLLPPEVKE